MRFNGQSWFWLTLILVGLGTAGCDDDGVLAPSGSGGSQPAGPAVIQLVTANSSYQVGETVVVEVTIDNAFDAGSVPFHLEFDPAVLQFLPPASEGPFMGRNGAATVFLASEVGPGGELVVGLSRLGVRHGATGTGTLATFQFRAVGPGPCDFRFTGAVVRDPDGRVLPATFNTAAVNVIP